MTTIASAIPRSRRPTHAHSVAFRAVTTIMIIVIGLTFTFGFGNVWLLALRLGVPAYVAPLVAPAVDLSILGLLIAIRELAVQGAAGTDIRPARRLLVFASLVTLALNIAEPLAGGQYGKAAFDAVGPLLLIGWAEIGPDLLRTMAEHLPAHAGPEEPAHVDNITGTLMPTEPTSEATAADPVPALKTGSGGTEAFVGEHATDRRPVPAQRDERLLALARTHDAHHWAQHHRPISAEALRKRLKIGAEPSRALVAQIRAETSHQSQLRHATDDPTRTSEVEAGTADWTASGATPAAPALASPASGADTQGS
ncbi:hypothetical protein [Pseudofrankia asymbiotica]|uniref:DUF2637 domain-containing protein n=1 Tax=Pseudofrankia asymbiotica TaxID=1834516 RepID=A0A1V2I4K8_9ACTN|nr:hypothetical protein [Pseudofrankia asymbiotica]ONH25520.1 hypothetical protein BL253_27325 [Pseudofrankia asymbiotica]